MSTYNLHNVIKRDKFDLEIGYLTESPCRECPMRMHSPDCAKDCQLIDRIQTILAAGISCTKSVRY